MAQTCAASSELAPHISEVASLPIPGPALVLSHGRLGDEANADPLLSTSQGTLQKWDYTQGLALLAIQRVSQRTGNEALCRYVQGVLRQDDRRRRSIHAYTSPTTASMASYAGKELFALYEGTHAEKYRRPSRTLRRQLREQPRNADGGFWHKKRYPHQIVAGRFVHGATVPRTVCEGLPPSPAAFDDVTRSSC